MNEVYSQDILIKQLKEETVDALLFKNICSIPMTKFNGRPFNLKQVN